MGICVNTKIQNAVNKWTIWVTVPMELYAVGFAAKSHDRENHSPVPDFAGGIEVWAPHPPAFEGWRFWYALEASMQRASLIKTQWIDINTGRKAPPLKIVKDGPPEIQNKRRAVRP
jgi:hypothetical protein